MKVYSVVVAYRPDPSVLTGLCRSLRTNGSEVLVVDNTDDASVAPFVAPKDCTLLALGRNAGVAEALNLGIRRALREGAEIVVLFDQDSEVPAGFITRLVRPLRAGQPGVAAPVARDKRTRRVYPVRRIDRFGRQHYVAIGECGEKDPVDVDIVISSGCAATAETFRTIGLMDEDFFIDFIDVEWCLRCRAKGVGIVVVPDAQMEHLIGERTVVAPFGLYRGIIHGPVRTYYKIRNSFLLARLRHVPTAFGMHQVASAMAHNAIQLLFVKQRLTYARTYLVAIAHGLRGVTGKRSVR